MSEERNAETLKEWIEAALTMAEVTGMSDDTVIPTWPADVVERAPGNLPELTVGALKQWQSDQKDIALSRAQKDYNYDCDLSLIDMSIRDIEFGFTVCPKCSAEIDHQKHPFDCLDWLKQMRQQLMRTQPERSAVPAGWKLVPVIATDEMADAMDPRRKNSMRYLRDAWMMGCIAAPQPPESEWVACSERLPTSSDADSDETVWAYDPGAFNPVQRPEWVDVSEMDMDFTHWMPTNKPQPPQGGRE